MIHFHIFLVSRQVICCGTTLRSFEGWLKPLLIYIVAQQMDFTILSDGLSDYLSCS